MRAISVSGSIHIHIYIYAYMYIFHIYIYIERERERKKKERDFLPVGRRDPYTRASGPLKPKPLSLEPRGSFLGLRGPSFGDLGLRLRFLLKSGGVFINNRTIPYYDRVHTGVSYIRELENLW